MHACVAVKRDLGHQKKEAYNLGYQKKEAYNLGHQKKAVSLGYAWMRGCQERPTIPEKRGV